MQLIDTHAHLYAEDFDADIEEVLERCKEQFVGQILLPNIEKNTYERMMNLTRSYPNMLKPMMGLHPCSVKPETYKQELEFVENTLDKESFIAIGEIGMDLYWDKTTQVIQEEALRTQLNWALERDLPVALHTRDATKEVIEIIRELNLTGLRGVFHCFGDGLEEANQIIDLGFYLGIGGVVTFKNSGLDKVLKSISMDHLVLETDSPYLAPVPFRGKRNESSYTYHVAKKLSEIYDNPITEIADITSANARELFRIP